MKSSKCLSAAVLAVGLIAVPGAALGAGFQNSGQSATATGMGYTGVANPNEPNASFYNPAIMGFREGLQIYAGDTIIIPSSTYEPLGGGETVETESQIFPPPHAHISYADIAGSGVSVGVGLAFPYGLGIAWDDEWVGRETIRSQDLKTAIVNPNVAYKLPGIDLSLAAGAQFAFSSVELERSQRLSSDQFVEAQLGASGTGIGFNAALMYQPLEELTVGLQYRSRITVDYEGDIHFEGDENTPFYSTFRDNPATTEITLPDTINFGIGYQLDKLFVNAQVDYTMWSTYDVVTLDIETDGDPNAIDELEIVNNWEDAFAFRVGGQYDVTEKLPVRLGFAYDMTPIPDETVNASLPGNDRIMGTLGAGYEFGDFRIDAAYSLVHALAREVENERTPPGTYETTAHNFAISAGYGF